MNATTDFEIDFLTQEELDRPLPISIGLSGGSGSGKTYSALLLASGIADALTGTTRAPICLVDTENRRGLHYRDTFPQIAAGHYVDFGPTDRAGNLVGYPPERWAALLDHVESSGVPVMVADTFSGAWEGIGGVLDLQATELERLVEAAQARNPNRAVDANQFTQLAWAAIKPRYRRLVNRIIRSRVHTILLTRAKPVIQKLERIDGQWVQRNAWKTKTRRADVPWDVASDPDLLFEMTVMAILDPEHPGCPRYQIKVADQFKGLFLPDRPITPEIGKAIIEWSMGRSSAREEKALMDAARAQAHKGTEAMRSWWTAAGAARQATLKVILDELRETAARADRADEDLGDAFAPAAEAMDAPEADEADSALPTTRG